MIGRMDAPRCPFCKSRRLTQREGLAGCERCGWVGLAELRRRYPRRPHRKTAKRR